MIEELFIDREKQILDSICHLYGHIRRGKVLLISCGLKKFLCEPFTHNEHTIQFIGGPNERYKALINEDKELGCYYRNKKLVLTYYSMFGVDKNEYFIKECININEYYDLLGNGNFGDIWLTFMKARDKYYELNKSEFY